MTEENLRLERVGRSDLGRVRPVLSRLYSEAYGPDDPFHSRERFEQRLDGYASSPSWEGIVAWADGRPAGYAFGAALRSSYWWEDSEPALDDAFTREDGERTFALYELLVRQPWRGTGLARRLHDRLLDGRPETRVTLLVQHDHSGVRGLYQRWGYRSVALLRPYPDAPLYDIMVRPLDPPRGDGLRNTGEDSRSGGRGAAG